MLSVWDFFFLRFILIHRFLTQINSFLFLFLLKISYIKGKKYLNIYKIINTNFFFFYKFSVKEISNMFKLKLVNVMTKDEGGIFFNITKLVKK